MIAGTDKDFVVCPLCRCQSATVFLTRTGQPVHQNQVFSLQEAACAIPRGDLSMAACAECGFVFNADFDPSKLAYGQAYDNNQAHSVSFQAYLDELVEHLVTTEGVTGQRIVDVGCGNGDFLRRLVADARLGNSGHGFDPAYRGPDCDCDGRARFVRAYYGPDCTDVPADVVVCRHVIEHVPDPVALLRSVRRALSGAGNARVYFETPDVAWILRNQVIWDFFYEHCSLFSPGSLSGAFAVAGFRVSGVRRVFQGQYLWIEALAEAPNASALGDTEGIHCVAAAFAAQEARARRQWDLTLSRLSDAGKVALWGGGAKGVTLANLLDPHRHRIDCIVDVNPNKQGRFLPGTGHPIVSPAELADRGVRFAIPMNPNYLAENRRLLADCGSDIVLIDSLTDNR